MSIWITYGGGQRHATRDKVAGFRTAGGHHAKLLLSDEVDEVLDLGLKGNVLSVGLLVRVGRGIASVCVGERHFVWRSCKESDGVVLLFVIEDKIRTRT